MRALVLAKIALASVLSCVGCASPEPPGQTTATPEDTVKALYGDESFFRARNGFPTAMLQHYSDCFTPDLVRHFESHNESVAKWLEEHEGQGLKLPMSEGPVFMANYEGADTFSVGRANVEGAGAEVPVSLSYTEGANTLQWVDVAILKMVDGVWRLDDIRFDPERFDDLSLRKRIALDQ